MPREIMTMVRFVLVGGSSTLLYFSLLALLRGVIDNIFALTSVSYAIAMCYNYLVQGRYTFQASGITRQSVIRYGIMHVVALLFNGSAMSVLVEGLHWPLFPTQIVVTAIVAAMTYVVSKHWVYKTAGHRA